MMEFKLPYYVLLLFGSLDVCTCNTFRSALSLYVKLSKISYRVHIDEILFQYRNRSIRSLVKVTLKIRCQVRVENEDLKGLLDRV